MLHRKDIQCKQTNIIRTHLRNIIGTPIPQNRERIPDTKNRKHERHCGLWLVVLNLEGNICDNNQTFNG